MNDLMGVADSDSNNTLLSDGTSKQLDPRLKQLLLIQYLQKMFGNQQAPQLAMPGQKQAAPAQQPQLDPMNLLRLQQLMGGGNNMLMSNAG